MRYHFEGEPQLIAHCYCRDCQYVSGSAFTTILCVPQEAFHLERGELGSYTVKGTSGGDVTRQFCRTCGSPLFTRADMMPGGVFVKCTSLDDPSWVKPTMCCWASRALPWAPRVDVAASFPENP